MKPTKREKKVKAEGLPAVVPKRDYTQIKLSFIASMARKKARKAAMAKARLQARRLGGTVTDVKINKQE